MRYLFDNNAFSEAHRLYYPLDTVPSFWRWLESGQMNGEAASIVKIKDELIAGDPKGERYPLARWALDVRPDFWVPTSPAAAAGLSEFVSWVAEPARPYSPQAVSEFMSSADLYLVAQCWADNATLVTRETADPACKRRVKIPDVCAASGVTCTDPFDAYRQLGMRL